MDQSVTVSKKTGRKNTKKIIVWEDVFAKEIKVKLGSELSNLLGIDYIDALSLEKTLLEADFNPKPVLENLVITLSNGKPSIRNEVFVETCEGEIFIIALISRPVSPKRVYGAHRRICIIYRNGFCSGPMESDVFPGFNKQTVNCDSPQFIKSVSMKFEEQYGEKIILADVHFEDNKGMDQKEVIRILLND